MNKLGTCSIAQCKRTFICLDVAHAEGFIAAAGSLDAPELIPAGSTVAAQQPTTTTR